MNEALGAKRLRICVIGGGAGGLAAVKILKDHKESQSGFWSVDAYEARDEIGGIWFVARVGTLYDLLY